MNWASPPAAVRGRAVTCQRECPGSGYGDDAGHDDHTAPPAPDDRADHPTFPTFTVLEGSGHPDLRGCDEAFARRRRRWRTHGRRPSQPQTTAVAMAAARRPRSIQDPGP